ncbi:GTP pyrophosphokinase [Paenibacillus naphthalenovorans]|uniref:GTP pyrophosphokinase n=2 Tax=Paenibacillus naphthalenovorans TaxID=162209 RepID=A0A0U2W0Y2_9BACL|nr:HD domain-containing protein [Paenibacillus naphthalenovorans]ALS22196.1 GTP pyrophosphokinase [Paenibacillus naphthalenovorans]
MSTLTRAIIMATEAHEGQVDKGGNPYILHPLRLLTKASDENARIVAVLHDVIEDTDLTLEHLRKEGFNEIIIEALDCLTRCKNESYDEFIQRIKSNDLARYVKLLDLDDNSDITRIQNPTDKDYERLRKYKKAVSDLLSL